MERSNSENIRAGNVWVDIQQVFYRMDGKCQRLLRPKAHEVYR